MTKNIPYFFNAHKTFEHYGSFSTLQKILIFVYCKNRTIERIHLPMRGIHIFEKPYYREIRPMRGRAMRGPPVYVT